MKYTYLNDFANKIKANSEMNKKPSFIAVEGRSGCGKSTFIKTYREEFCKYFCDNKGCTHLKVLSPSNLFYKKEIKTLDDVSELQLDYYNLHRDILNGACDDCRGFDRSDKVFLSDRSVISGEIMLKTLSQIAPNLKFIHNKYEELLKAYKRIFNFYVIEVVDMQKGYVDSFCNINDRVLLFNEIPICE